MTSFKKHKKGLEQIIDLALQIDDPHKLVSAVQRGLAKMFRHLNFRSISNSAKLSVADTLACVNRGKVPTLLLSGRGGTRFASLRVIGVWKVLMKNEI